MDFVGLDVYLLCIMKFVYSVPYRKNKQKEKNLLNDEISYGNQMYTYYY